MNRQHGPRSSGGSATRQGQIVRRLGPWRRAGGRDLYPNRDLQAQRRRSPADLGEVISRVVQGHTQGDIDQMLPRAYRTEASAVS